MELPVTLKLQLIILAQNILSVQRGELESQMWNIKISAVSEFKATMIYSFSQFWTRKKENTVSLLKS